MTKPDEKKVIFVCTGNTCRSPMAEAIFRSEAKRRGLQVQVGSAGTEAAVGKGINLYSLRTLAAHGLAVENFTATQLTAQQAAEAFAVVCMTEPQKRQVASLVAHLPSKENAQSQNVYAFSDFCGYSIPDPYGGSMEVYDCTFQALEGGMSAVIEGLFPAEPLKAEAKLPERTSGKSMAQKKKSPPKKSASACKKTTNKSGAKKPSVKKENEEK